MPAGRPRKIESPEWLENKFREYLDDCGKFVEWRMSNSGKLVEVPTPQVPMMGKFQYLLDLTPEGWSKYHDYPEYSDTLKKIERTIEALKADALANNRGNTTGIIFDLKANYGWSDKQQIDLNHSGESMTVNIVRPKKEE